MGFHKTILSVEPWQLNESNRDSLPFALNAIKMERISFVRQKRQTRNVNICEIENGTAHAFDDIFLYLLFNIQAILGKCSFHLDIFRIGIFSTYSNGNQSTTANNGKWNVESSKDDKTLIVTRHKCKRSYGRHVRRDRWRNNNMCCCSVHFKF